MNRYEKWLWCTYDKSAQPHLTFEYMQMIIATLRKTTIHVGKNSQTSTGPIQMQATL